MKTKAEGKGKPEKVLELPPLCCKCGAAVEGSYHGKDYCGAHLVQALRGEP